MDKKVLVSILAMTSAPSLTAWADVKEKAKAADARGGSLLY